MSKWVTTFDRLPDVGKPVQVYTKHGLYRSAVLLKDGEHTAFFEYPVSPLWRKRLPLVDMWQDDTAEQKCDYQGLSNEHRWLRENNQVVTVP